MRFFVHVTASDAIRNLTGSCGTQTVELDPATLSEELRNEMAQLAHEGERGVELKESAYNKTCLAVPAATAEALVSTLQKRIDRRKAEEAARAEKIRQEIDEYRRYLANPTPDTPWAPNYSKDSEETKSLWRQVKAVAAERLLRSRKNSDEPTASRFVDAAALLPEDNAERQRWQRDCERAKAEARAQAEREKAEKAAAEARAAAERDAWIKAHGSKRLKRMAAEGIELEATYRDERLAAERPGWRWYQAVEGTYDDPRNPDDEAFALLDAARAIDSKCRLAYWTVEWDEDDADYDLDAGKYRWSGYVAIGEFLDREIVYGGPDIEAETRPA